MVNIVTACIGKKMFTTLTIHGCETIAHVARFEWDVEAHLFIIIILFNDFRRLESIVNESKFHYARARTHTHTRTHARTQPHIHLLIPAKGARRNAAENKRAYSRKHQYHDVD